MPKKGPKNLEKKGSKVDVDSPAHYAGVMLEGIRGEFQLLAEAVDISRSQLEHRIRESNAELKQGIEDTRTALKMTQSHLETKIEGVRTELKRDIAELKQELSGKIDKIGVRLDHHDEEITHLKEAQALS